MKGLAEGFWVVLALGGLGIGDVTYCGVDVFKLGVGLQCRFVSGRGECGEGRWGMRGRVRRVGAVRGEAVG